MYLLFSAFMLSDFLMLNIGKYLGKKVFPGDIKNTEIIQQNFMGLYHHIFSGSLLSYMIYTNFDDYGLNNDGTVSLLKTKNCIYKSFNKNLYTIIILFEISYYLISILNTLFLKINKRVDAKIQYVHHIVTLGLIYIGTIHPAGEFCTIYILFTHNLCDIPIKIYYIGKKLKNQLFYYNKFYINLFNILSSFTILGSWLYLRLYMYGSLTFAIVYVYPEESNLITKACLCILYVFNIFWFYLCIKGVFIEGILKKEKSTLYDK